MKFNSKSIDCTPIVVPYIISNGTYKEQNLNTESKNTLSIPGISDEALDSDESNSILSLIHAWVITVAKSQGSEWDHIIFIIRDKGPYTNRNLVYTAVTRAKHSVNVLGNASFLTAAIMQPDKYIFDNLSLIYNSLNMKCLEI